jgi:hypothetical protein
MFILLHFPRVWHLLDLLSFWRLIIVFLTYIPIIFRRILLT